MGIETKQELMNVEQNREQLIAQRKQFQQQLIEIENAQKEIKDAKETYKIIGNFMVKRTNEKTKKELEEKEEIIKVRITTIEKQEEKLKEKIKELQKQILKKEKK